LPSPPSPDPAGPGTRPAPTPRGAPRPQPDGSLHADGSISLIRGGPVTVLVDTGGPWDRERLLELLAGQGLSPEAVTHVVCTHGHSDHVGNVNLFPG
ncbi:Metallo-beta-lactamase domain-containing protein 1, partial [Eudyptes chrysocome]